MSIDFLKGHMGGNEIILLYGNQIPEEKFMEVALCVLDPPNIGGHEVGIFSKSTRHNHLRTKIVGRSSRHFISMCGGLTQVLGKALVETNFPRCFDIEIKEPATEIILETDCGPIPLKIEASNGRFKRVWTNMKPFIDECYTLGVEHITTKRVEGMRVGKFLVVNAGDAKEVYSNVDFENLNELSERALMEMQDAFNEQRYLQQRLLDFALYDRHPQYGGMVRAIYPHNIRGGHVEPTCGTGTVAIGIAMTGSGQIEDGATTILIESGGRRVIGGPDITELMIKVEKGRVVDAEFSHSLVEILASGQCFIENKVGFCPGS